MSDETSEGVHVDPERLSYDAAGMLADDGQSARQAVDDVGSIDLHSLLRRIAGEARTEATLQSEIHTLLLAVGLNLTDDDLSNVTLESPSGLRRRIDIEVGHVCIEVKKNLRPGRSLDDAILQEAVQLCIRQ